MIVIILRPQGTGYINLRNGAFARFFMLQRQIRQMCLASMEDFLPIMHTICENLYFSLRRFLFLWSIVEIISVYAPMFDVLKENSMYPVCAYSILSCLDL